MTSSPTNSPTTTSLTPRIQLTNAPLTPTSNPTTAQLYQHYCQHLQPQQIQLESRHFHQHQIQQECQLYIESIIEDLKIHLQRAISVGKQVVNTVVINEFVKLIAQCKSDYGGLFLVIFKYVHVESMIKYCDYL